MQPRAAFRGWTGGILYADPVREQIVMRIGRPYGDAVQYLRRLDGNPWGTADEQHVTVPTAEDPGDDVDIRLSEPIARLLFDLLLDHYGGPGADRMLRDDYLHERTRVDKLMEALVNPARVVTGGT